MQLKHESINETTILIEFDGRLDASTAFTCKESVMNLMEKGPNRIIIDMGKVRFIDSTGLGLLLSILKEMSKRNGDVRLACLNNEAKRLFSLVRFDKIFDCFDSVDTAAENIRPGNR